MGDVESRDLYPAKDKIAADGRDNIGIHIQGSDFAGSRPVGVFSGRLPYGRTFLAPL